MCMHLNIIFNVLLIDCCAMILIIFILNNGYLVMFVLFF